MSLTRVVAADTSGTNYDTVPTNAVASGAKDVGGSATKITSTSQLDGVGIDRYDAGVFGSTVLDNSVADKALSSGTFAYNNDNGLIRRVTSYISGVSNNVLANAANSGYATSIHSNTTSYTAKIRSGLEAGKFNQVTGEWAVGYPQNSVDSFGTDNAAAVSRADQDSLTYMVNGKTATTTNYSSKNG